MDKREAVRVPVQVRARCRSHGTVIDGLVEDVSWNGLFLRASSSIGEGTAAELDLELPGEETLRLAVEVVRIERRGDEIGMGLRFVGRRERTRPLANFIMRQHQASR
ncbi:MAG TPA: PilZ domain-containing protein [Kofleriaceae bacterium]|nr:PilZ domain-containing protein [Kofleriaceae bacterium]